MTTGPQRDRKAMLTKLRWKIARQGRHPQLKSGVPHWACPDCGQPCRCTDLLARQAPHQRCGWKEL